MAKKKKKTLPKNFREMIEAGDVAALKAVYNDCELNAYGTFDKGTALHFYDVPDELVRYLVEQGLDIDTPTAVYKRTPLEEHATVGNNTLVKWQLNLGADINGVNG
jgi:ankyrin repeat protein